MCKQQIVTNNINIPLNINKTQRIKTFINENIGTKVSN